jgi:hypothetical protein
MHPTEVVVSVVDLDHITMAIIPLRELICQPREPSNAPIFTFPQKERHLWRMNVVSAMGPVFVKIVSMIRVVLLKH